MVQGLSAPEQAIKLILGLILEPISRDEVTHLHHVMLNPAKIAQKHKKTSHF